MSTYNSPVNVEPATLVRSANINDLDAAVTEAFGFLPDETLLKQGKHLYAVDTGTANTHLVSLPVSPGSYVDGLSFTFKAKTSNTAACTVNVNSLGVVAISREDGTDLVTGDIVAGQMCTVRYNVTTSKFQLEGTNAASSAVAAAASAAASAASAATAATQAGNATTQANNAAASAATAVSAPGTASTSASSISLTAGTKTFSTQAGKGYAVGASVKFARTSDVTKWAVGSVSSYDSGTGELVLSVDANDVSGTGTFSDWTLSVSGHRGPAGSAGISNVVSTSSNYTLTSTPTVLRVTPTGFGLTITLPDATAINPISLLAAIINDGPYPVRVIDSTGTLKGFVPSFNRIDVSLISSSAAGDWGFSNIKKVGPSAQLVNSVITSVITCITIDSDRELILGGSLYGVIYNRTTNTFGTPVLIRSVANLAACVLSGANQVLVVSNHYNTALEAVTLTLSGNAITVNTAATATLSANMNGFATGCGLVQVGAGFTTLYELSTPANEIRALTISGTTVTIGSATSLNPTAGTAQFVSGSTVIAMSRNGASFSATPYTLSGSSLVAGTAYTDSNSSFTRIHAMASGRWMVQRGTSVTLLSLSGTTVTGSHVAVTGLSAISDSIPIGSNRLLVMSNSDSSNNANLFTDTSGTLSVGTAITINTTTNKKIGLYVKGTTAYVASVDSDAYKQLIEVSCSGSSPVLGKVSSFIGTSASGSLGTLEATEVDLVGRKSVNNIYGNYFVQSLASSGGTSPTRFPVVNDGVFSSNSVYDFDGVSPGTCNRGRLNSERWILSSNSSVLTKVECVL